jgi:hypothetical protein
MPGSFVSNVAEAITTPFIDSPAMIFQCIPAVSQLAPREQISPEVDDPWTGLNVLYLPESTHAFPRFPHCHDGAFHNAVMAGCRLHSAWSCL